VDGVSSAKGPPLRGGIVPHAGWFFSGRIAYNVIRELARHASDPNTLVLFGSHLSPSSPISLMGHGSFGTPLGDIPIDQELTDVLAQKFNIQWESLDHHAPDNTVELQAPMIKYLLPNVRLVVISAPPREEILQLADTVVDIATQLDRHIVTLGSTDLTHYGPNYGWMPKGLGPAALKWVKEENDKRLIDLACRLDAKGLIDEALENANACCPGAAAAALRCGQKLGATNGELLVYSTSADIRPDVSFVGYAGIVF
jgi:hypothetical protein